MKYCLSRLRYGTYWHQRRVCLLSWRAYRDTFCGRNTTTGVFPELVMLSSTLPSPFTPCSTKEQVEIPPNAAASVSIAEPRFIYASCRHPPARGSFFVAPILTILKGKPSVAM